MISLLEIAQNINEAEVDDDEIIKYKDKDGESAEMKAGSAKTMEKDHPAKIAWDKMQNDGGDDKKDSGGKLGGSDFDRDANRADDDREEDPNVKGKDEPKRKLTQKGEKIQKAKEEFEDDAKYIDDPTEFDDWIEDNMDNIDINEKEISYSNDFGSNQIVLALEKYRDLWNDDDPDEEDAKDELVNLITKRLDTMVDINRETPTVKAEPKSKQTAADSREARNRVIKRIGRQAFDKLSYGEMEAEYEKELKAMGKRESIKVIDGKKYKAIKESKEPTKPNIHPFKETYKKIGGK